MNVLERKESIAKTKASSIRIELEYIPGPVEALDEYRAYHEKLGINCYGLTAEAAIASARMEAEGLFLGDMSLIDTIIE